LLKCALPWSRSVRLISPADAMAPGVAALSSMSDVWQPDTRSARQASAVPARKVGPPRLMGRPRLAFMPELASIIPCIVIAPPRYWVRHRRQRPRFAARRRPAGDAVPDRPA